MTINERVSPKRLAEIIARAEVCDDSVLTDYRDIESIARELQQYRAAAEPVAWQWFHLNQWNVTNNENLVRELVWDGVKVVPLYTAPRPSELLKIIERLCASGYEYNDGPVDETNAGAVVDIVLQQLADAVAQCDAAPQVTSVPDLKCDDDGNTTSEFDHGWNACRAAMLSNVTLTDEGKTVGPDYRDIVERVAVVLHGSVTDLALLPVTAQSVMNKLSAPAVQAEQLSGNTEPVSHPYTLPDDKQRLDWLDAQNKRLNEYYGTAYGWKFDANFQRNAMILNDSNYPVMNVRQAIDEAMRTATRLQESQEVKK